MIVTLMGLVLFVLGVLSRFFSLPLYKRITESESRSVTPSRLLKRPLFEVESDRDWLNRIVVTTYGVLIAGMALLLIGVLFQV